MYVVPVTTFDELRAIRQPWNALANGVPFRRWEWLHPWWRQYGRGCRLLVLLVRDKLGECIGIAPWYVERTAAKGRAIRMLGGGEACSDYTTVLAAPSREDEVAFTLAEYLTSEKAGRWDLLELEAIDADDRVVPSLVHYLKDRGQGSFWKPVHQTWRVALPETWDDFLLMQSKSHRKQLRRFERRILDSGAARLHQAVDLASFAAAWQTFVDLHQRRRASLGQPGCFSSQLFSAFHREAARGLLDAGLLRLFWLELDGRPIAAEYQVSSGGITYAYQSGVDPDRLDEEPGQLITLATIRRAIEDGQRGFDFLRGDEPYKAHWRAEPRQAFDYRVIRNRTAAKLRHGLRLAADGVKSWIKTGFAR